MTQPTLLITGGAGFIGSNLVRRALADDRLREQGARVVVFDKLTYAGSLENLRDVEGNERFVFVRGDIAERDQVREAFQTHRPTAVLNLAAESHVDRSIDGPGEFVRTNIVGTFELLEAARALLAEQPELREHFRFLHVSTDEVFGSLGPTGAFEETTPYDPSSPYSASKASADHLARAFGRTYGMPVLVTNCSNNYGPYQFPEKLIPLMVLNAVEGKDLPIYGDGSNVRDWLHVDDHCRGILRVLEAAEPGSSYNIGGNSERTNLEIVDTLCAVLEDEMPGNSALAARGLTNYTDLKKFVTDRPGHDQRYAIDASRIAGDLDWHPRHTFEDGLRETIRWYLQNRGWCEAVQDESSRDRLGTT